MEIHRKAIVFNSFNSDRVSEAPKGRRKTIGAHHRTIGTHHRLLPPLQGLMLCRAIQGRCPCLYSAVPSGLIFVSPISRGDAPAWTIGAHHRLLSSLRDFLPLLARRVAQCAPLPLPWGESCSFKATWVLKVSCRETIGFSAGNQRFLGWKLRRAVRME